ncbi:MAG: GNAT family N-acetyltransferase [Rhodospirillales bacterium]
MAAAGATWLVEPFGDRHDRTEFESGVEALDRFLKQHASQHARRRFAGTFVAVAPGAPAVLGYYTLSAAGVDLDRLPETTARKLPRYPSVPAALVGRLAVDRRRRGRGLGGVLLRDAIKRCVRSELSAYALLVDAKDDAAAAFYRRHGFSDLSDGLKRLFIPLATAAKLLD